MNISAAARACGLPVKTIRYYEQVGLVAPRRCANGYRDFGAAEIARLRFLAEARVLGFSLEDCRLLLGLSADEGRASRDVRRVTLHHLEEVRARIAALRDLEAVLEELVARCPGDDGPDCAILDRLDGGSAEKNGQG
ncbi:MerR family DNA-binding protein [Mangrovicoccus algicola]|uniref:MerR family DNA-binding protein n=1 Tax=Mangrovicoccus algicola TaxID=2771008 RepID=A0A8J7CMF5_9RHOB|nr:MerR family DNA-binding protein [Mangrovicoccus algicola]MBE3640366.1 MerR family DNA-binding protein [Mangrovicoccus algicola]